MGHGHHAATSKLVSALSSLSCDEAIGDLLRDAGCGPKAGIAIADAMRASTSKSLGELDLCGLDLCDEGALPILRTLAEAAPGCTRSLDLGANSLGRSAAAALAPLLRLDNYEDAALLLPIRELRLARNALNGSACHALLAPPLDASELGPIGLTALALSFNPLGEAGGEALGTALASGRLMRLSSLQLHGCQLGAAGAKALAAGLRGGKALSHLDLCGNALFDEGACAVAAALPSAPASLAELLMSRNALGDAGAHALATSLIRRPSSCRLRLLGLSHNKLRDASAEALAEALAAAPADGGNRSIESLDLGGNKLGLASVMALGDALVANPTLTSLDLSANRRCPPEALFALDELCAHNRAHSRGNSDRTNSWHPRKRRPRSRRLAYDGCSRILDLMWAVPVEVAAEVRP